MLQRAIHRRLERAVRQVAGAGFIKAALDGGFGHHRRALSDFFDAFVDLLRIGHLRGADQIQHLGLRLHHVGRNPAGIGDGVMDARFLNDVFVEEVGAGSHQRHGVQRAAPQMRGVGRVCRHAVKTPGCLNIRQRADVKHPGEGFRVPGDGGIDVIKQTFAHHKGFPGATFLAGTAIKTHRSAAAVLLQPAFHRHRARKRRGA